MSQPPDPPQQPGQWPPPPPAGPGGPGAPGGPGGPVGPGGPGGFGGTYGQFGPPKKSPTGLIVALVVVGVLLLGGLVTGGVFLLRGSDDDSASSDGSSETTEAGDDETDGESEEPAAPAEGDIVGTGYHYSLPDGWQDISDGSEVSSQPGLDTGAANGPSIQGATANVLVETGPSGGMSTEQLRDQLKSTYESQFDVEVQELPGRDVGGESMSALSLTRPNPLNESIEVEQVSYVVVRDDTGFVITSSRVTSASDAEVEVQQLLDTWVWD